MYTIERKVRYSECDEDCRMRLSSIINHFQDSSSEHSESLGLGTDYLKSVKRAWILNSWQIVIERYPKLHEQIEVSTWPTGFKGVFGPRNFCMKTSDGEMLAYANTLWVYMDMEKKMPTKEAGLNVFCEKPDAVSVAEAEKMKAAKSGVLVDYCGITVEKDTVLRSDLRKAGVDYFVVKNTILGRAIDGTSVEGMKSALEGTTAIALSNEDYTAAARILCKFAEGHENFKVKSGFLDGKVVDVATIVSLAKLPSKEVLLATVLSAFQAPIAAFARAVQAIVDKDGSADAE